MTAKRTPAWRPLLVIGGACLVLASLAIVPPRAAERGVVGGEAGEATEQVDRGPAGDAGPRSTTRTVTTGPQLSCAPGRNGGSTDVGVTADAIKLGATVVDSGIGASFLGDARFGMLAVVNRVNRSGGICGRKLELTIVDDAWDFARGGEFIRNLVEDKKVFALAVVPSSEGLKNVSDSGYLRREKVPVVGTDGMLIHQYEDPYIFPVAASTISAMHVIAKYAHDTGAKNFGIVYEHTYHFGIEGAFAFNAAVKRLTGDDVPGYSDPLADPKCEGRFCGIAAGQASYGTEIERFNGACFADPGCDFVVMLLEPATALTWLAGGALTPSAGLRMAGPQPLFTRDFAEECGSRCHNLMLWTGYIPPIGGNAGLPAVKRFIDDVRVTSSSADYTNTFVEGAYVGMSMLVEALEQVGPNLTRESLMAVLNGFEYDGGLSSPLTWAAGDHFANTRVRAYSIQFKDRFAGWRDERIVMKDPWVGKDIP
ncbi:MAG TPA: ABC transporter substrate-binding protein [Actinomycetota bacterium]